MSVFENPKMINKRPQHRRKTPSFSSSLLESIYLTIDEPKQETEQQQTENSVPYKRNNAIEAEEEIANLRRAIMVEKWMKNYYQYTQKVEHFNSDSSNVQNDPGSKCEGKFIMRTKLRALKIYGDLKKVKQPISPGGKIAKFLNSIFNSRNLKKNNIENWSSMKKSRSVKDSTMNKCVTFCPVSLIYEYDDEPRLQLKKNHISINGFSYFEENHLNKHKFGGFYNGKCDYDDDEEYGEDSKSCASSDLFELENIDMVGVHSNNELPVYGTTIFKINRVSG